jgi:hypothetical protein
MFYTKNGLLNLSARCLMYGNICKCTSLFLFSKIIEPEIIGYMKKHLLLLIASRVGGFYSMRNIIQNEKVNLFFHLFGTYWELSVYTKFFKK